MPKFPEGNNPHPAEIPFPAFACSRLKHDLENCVTVAEMVSNVVAGHARYHMMCALQCMLAEIHTRCIEIAASVAETPSDDT